MIDVAPDSSRDEPQSYELALAELERLVAQMESGQMPLDGLLESYRRAATLLEFCRARLQAVATRYANSTTATLKPSKIKVRQSK